VRDEDSEKSSVRDEDSEKSWGKAEDSEKSSVRDEDLEKLSVRDEDSEKSSVRARTRRSRGEDEDLEKSSVRDEDSEKLSVRGEDLEKSSAKVTAASCQEWASQIRGFADFEPALARAPQLDWRRQRELQQCERISVHSPVFCPLARETPITLERLA
jgi:hypothetical protein